MMREKIRDYKVYISWQYRLIILFLLPVIECLYVLFEIRRKSMIGGIAQMNYCLLPATWIVVMLMTDRVILGPVYHGNTSVEFLKSSRQGKTVFQNVLNADRYIRFVVLAAVMFISAMIMQVVGGYAEMGRLWSMAWLATVSTHAATEFGNAVSRQIRDLWVSVLVIYGVELTLIPVVLTVLTGASTWTLLLLSAGYLAADMGVIYIQDRMIRRLVVTEWYQDAEK